MFLLRWVKGWWREMNAIWDEMRKIEEGLQPLSLEYQVTIPRTTAVMYFAPIPPLARFLQSQLFDVARHR